MLRLLVLFVNFSFVHCNVTVAPKNTVVYVGQRMEMECRAENNSTIRSWTYLPESSSSNQNIFALDAKGEKKIQTNIGVDVNEKGSGIIYMNSTNIEDAGAYTCSVETGKNNIVKYIALLIVLESDPVCLDNFTFYENGSLTDGNNIWVQCNVSYRGQWTPTMEWRLHSESNDSVLQGITVIEGSTVTSSISITVGSQHNGSHFSCRTFFLPENIRLTENTKSSSNVDKSSPDFSKIWISSLIILQENGELTTTIADIETTSVTSTKDGEPEVVTSKSFDWFSISISLVAVVSVFFIAIAIALCNYCVQLRKKNFDKLAEYERGTAEGRHSGEYDFIQDPATYGYSAIDESMISDDNFQCTPRQGPLPPIGYSSLMPLNDTPDAYKKLETQDAEGASTNDMTSDYLTPKDEEVPCDSTGGISSETKTEYIPPYLDLRSSTVIEKEGSSEAEFESAGITEEFPSEYLTNVSEFYNSECPEKCMPSSDMKTMATKQLDYIRSPTADVPSNGDEIPSTYLTMGEADQTKMNIYST